MVPVETSADNLSQHSGIELRGYRTENTEEPPPPYPGNVMLVAPRDTHSMEYICYPHSWSPGQSTRTRQIETAGEIVQGSPNGRRSRASSGQSHISVGPGRIQVVNAWSDNETGRGTSHNERNEVRRTNRHQSNVDIMNSVPNQRDVNTSRTVVSLSERGPREVISITPMTPPENLQHLDSL